MTAAELRVIRERLGITGEWLAAYLGVQGRTWRRWEAGTSPIPDAVTRALEELTAMTEGAAAQIVAQLRDTTDPAVIVYRTDEDYWRANPGDARLASWHRAVAARVLEEIPDLHIDYREA